MAIFPSNTNVCTFLASALLIFTFSSCELREDPQYTGYIDQAKKEYEQGNLPASIKAVDKYIAEALHSGDNNAIGDAHFRRGTLNLMLDSVSLAFDDYKVAEHYLSQGSDKKTYGKVLKRLGDIFYDYYSYEKALSYYTKSLEIAEDQGDDKNIANYTYGVARAHRKLGNVEASIDMYHASLDMEEKLERFKEYIDVWLELSLLHTEYERYERAKEINDDIINRTSFDTLKTYAWPKAKINIGNNHIYLGNLEEAESNLREALQFNSLDTRYQSVAYNNLGRVYRKRGQPNLAALNFQKSLELNSSYVDVEEVLVTRAEIISMFDGEHQKDSLIKYLKMVAPIALKAAEDRQKILNSKNSVKLLLEYKDNNYITAKKEEDKLLPWQIGVSILILALVIITLHKFYSDTKTPNMILESENIKNRQIVENMGKWVVFNKHHIEELQQQQNDLDSLD